MKNVVVISTSLRPGSNSHALAEQFEEGAKSAGNEVELISLKWKEIKDDLARTTHSRSEWRLTTRPSALLS